MRDITEVINKIKAEIPETEKDFHSLLDKISYSSNYKAPEIMSDCWAQLQMCLLRFIGKPEKEWHCKVLAIFSGHSLEEIMDYYLIRG